MQRLLLLACSGRKRHDVALLPAIERYDGPAWRTLRAYIRAEPTKAADLDVFVLSAMYGIFPAVQPIDDYDFKITKERVQSFQVVTPGKYTLLDRIGALGGYRATMIAGGKLYQQVLPWAPEHTGLLTRTGNGSIGVQLGQLKQWLRATQE